MIKVDMDNQAKNNHQQMMGHEYTTDIQQKILIDQNKILNRNLIISQIANLICATVIAFGIHKLTNNQVIWIWYGAVLLITGARFSFWYFYRRNPEANELHFYLFIVGVILSASLWGIAGSILMPKDNLVAEMVIIVIMAGITSGGVQSLQASLPACFIFVIFIILPLTIWLFLQPNLAHNFLGITLATYLFFMLGISWRNHRLLIQSLRLYYENLKLIEDLFYSNKKLQQREHDIGFVTKMNDMLQTCHESKEAYLIITRAAESLFSNMSGGLCIFNKHKNNVETVKQWGQDNLTSVFSFNDCWALREGRAYHIDDDQSLICNHFKSKPENYLCSPLLLPNETIGLLNLNTSEHNLISDYQVKLAYTFSEVIKLSLANIQLHEKLRDQTIHDPLTGLFNRRYLTEALSRELKRVRREKTTLSISMLDIDDFKQFNSDYGHEAGDEILKAVGSKLNERFRGSDIACRFGGEEFIVVLNNTDLNDAASRMERIRKEIKETHIYFRNQLLPQITISIGVAEAPQDGQTMEEIIHCADKALYSAKDKGKDRIETFHNITSTS